MTTRNKTVLFILGAGFVPQVAAATLRCLKLVKYLSNFGWKSIILAKKSYEKANIDLNLLNEVPFSTKIFYVKDIINPRIGKNKLGQLLKFIFIPDPDFFWLISAYPKAKHIIEKYAPDVIFTSSPPPTSHILGYLLNKKYNIPWIADFRDPWTFNEDYFSPSPIHSKFERNLELHIISKANKIFQVTKPFVEDFYNNFPFIPRDRVMWLPNGFDPEDFKNNRQRVGERMLFTYGGSLYKRYPITFLKAFSELFREEPKLRDYIKIVFYGQIAPNKLREINSYDFEDIIDAKGQVSYKDSIYYLINSDVLILSVAEKSSYRKVLTSRIFNYLASGRFIIAIVPTDGAIADLITKTKTGVVVDPKDVKKMKRIIFGLWKEWKEYGNIKVNPDLNVIKTFSRKEQAKLLADIMGNYVGGEKDESR